MPRCSYPGCTNLVSDARYHAGHTTCIELHSQAAKTFTVVPMPKSNGVVGTVEDLKGVSSSHKGTSPSALGGGEWYLDAWHLENLETLPYHQVRKSPSAPARPPRYQPVPDNQISQSLLMALLEARLNPAGDIFVTLSEGPAMTEGWRKGLLTSRSAPSRLTALGKLAREMANRGVQPDLSKLR